jgi:hypothetical protein
MSELSRPMTSKPTLEEFAEAEIQRKLAKIKRELFDNPDASFAESGALSSAAKYEKHLRKTAKQSAPMIYVDTLPRQPLPDGWVLVHNRCRPHRTLGANCFRAWVEPLDNAKHVQCDCGWPATFGRKARLHYVRWAAHCRTSA